MKKFIVETYYTCTFKTIHTLDDLNDKELSKIDNRTDGNVEVIDVKLNNRKTKRLFSCVLAKSNIKLSRRLTGVAPINQEASLYIIPTIPDTNPIPPETIKLNDIKKRLSADFEVIITSFFLNDINIPENNNAHPRIRRNNSFSTMRLPPR